MTSTDVALAIIAVKTDSRKPLVQRRQQEIDRDNMHAPAKPPRRRCILSAQQQAAIEKVYFVHLAELAAWRGMRQVVRERSSGDRLVSRWEPPWPRIPHETIAHSPRYGIFLPVTKLKAHLKQFGKDFRKDLRSGAFSPTDLPWWAVRTASGCTLAADRFHRSLALQQAINPAKWTALPRTEQHPEEGVERGEGSSSELRSTAASTGERRTVSPVNDSATADLSQDHGLTTRQEPAAQVRGEPVGSASQRGQRALCIVSRRWHEALQCVTWRVVWDDGSESSERDDCVLDRALVDQYNVRAARERARGAALANASEVQVDLSAGSEAECAIQL